MKTYGLVRNGRYVGTIHMTAIGLSEDETPARHNERWTDFEKEMLQEAFGIFVKKKAVKHGRTETSIMGKIRKMLPNYKKG